MFALHIVHQNEEKNIQTKQFNAKKEHKKKQEEEIHEAFGN